ncbi:elongation factor P [Venenivibrio stagnispumantis]|uniref:Elongation factor P n=1 Tax=Venenivibrio stagnispumantis TaxID=407998 RepID=A0AA45WJ28_9AQUI|nr:elongation factor P [Venenivibrio stagnispumantis]MCW4572512.1 elongation factor P [Venenivibrio stagnispumantis]SMP02115.1 elongation factor P [Venenivibrio stagnispumantis]
MGVKIDINSIKRDMFILVDNQPFRVVGYEHVKPGKGQAFVRVKAKNMKTGNVTEFTFKSSDSIELADFEQRFMNYSYADGSNYYFMDTNTYETFAVPAELMEEEAKFLKEGMQVVVFLDRGNPIGIELPKHEVYEVIETEPGVKGDTATSATKPAKIETGAVINVPLFINVGDKIKVDTRSGTYIERVK